MKIFVSSRMLELSNERKIAVDSLHFAGHTPLYIETEPEVKDLDAKKAMDSLLNSADAFLLIYYLSEGKLEPILNRLTPIQYEYKVFRELHPNGPVMFFRRVPDENVNPSRSLIDWFGLETKENTTIKYAEFKKPRLLARAIIDSVNELNLETDEKVSRRQIIIRYNGPDFTNLIGTVSEFIFSRHKLNIDYISHAGRGGLATFHIICSPRGDFPSLADLQRDLLDGIKNEILVAKEKNHYVDKEKILTSLELSVDEDISVSVHDQFYVELRTIDAPGQLNAVSKVLKELNFIIHELQLKPTPPEYDRQITIALWMSKHESLDAKELKTNLIDLETTMNNLIGVRAFSIRTIESQ